MDDFDYKVYVNQKLILAGFKPDELTEDQKDIILQPSEAPENYACDGEITPRQSLVHWINSMSRTGLTMKQILRARKMNKL